MKKAQLNDDPKNPGYKTWMVEKVVQICPWVPVQFLPGKLAGQIEQIQKPCSTSCPMLEISDTFILVSCGGDLVEISIDKTIPPFTILKS